MLEAADADAAGGTEGAAASAADGVQGPADSSEPSDSEDGAEGETGEDFDVEAMARQILEQAALAGDEGAQREMRRLAGAGAGAATAAPAQPERAEPRASGQRVTRQKKGRKRSRITVVET